MIILKVFLIFMAVVSGGMVVLTLLYGILDTIGTIAKRHDNNRKE